MTVDDVHLHVAENYLIDTPLLPMTKGDWVGFISANLTDEYSLCDPEEMYWTILGERDALIDFLIHHEVKIGKTKE